jgi:hypothetical protein
MSEQDIAIAPCVFHGDDPATCMQHSGQAPCMTETETSWLMKMETEKHELINERNALATQVNRLDVLIGILEDIVPNLNEGDYEKYVILGRLQELRGQVKEGE